VAKLDFTKKTPLRKVMIEYENQQQKGKNVQVISTYDKAGAVTSGAPPSAPNLIANAGERAGSPEQSLRDTQQSFTSLHTATERGMSPGSARRFRRSKDFANQSSYSGWNERQGGSEIRSRRESAVKMSTPLENDFRKSNTQFGDTGASWKSKREYVPSATASESFLPDISGNNPRRPPVPDGSGMTYGSGFKMDRSMGGGSLGRAAGFSSSQVEDRTTQSRSSRYAGAPPAM